MKKSTLSSVRAREKRFVLGTRFYGREILQGGEKKEEEEEEDGGKGKERINRRDGRKWRRNALNLSRSSNPRGDSKSIDTKFAKIGPRSGMRRP